MGGAVGGAVGGATLAKVMVRVGVRGMLFMPLPLVWARLPVAQIVASVSAKSGC